MYVVYIPHIEALENFRSIYVTYLQKETGDFIVSKTSMYVCMNVCMYADILIVKIFSICMHLGMNVQCAFYVCMYVCMNICIC